MNPQQTTLPSIPNRRLKARETVWHGLNQVADVATSTGMETGLRRGLQDWAVFLQDGPPQL